MDDLPAGTFEGTHSHDGANLVTTSGLPDGAKDGWVPIAGVEVFECGCTQKALPDDLQAEWKVDDTLYMFFEPPWARGGAAGDCIQHKNLAGMGVLCMILFSICVQAAEGLHYGVVPYVSRPALGIVSGMVGAGGNLGSVIALAAFFRGKTTRTDQGFLNLGILVMAISALMFAIYFPEHGGMLVKAGGLGKYDPQIIKPPADYRGADSMDFGNVNLEGMNDGKPASDKKPASQAEVNA